MRQLFTPEFVKFALVGGFAALVNFGSRIIFSEWMDFRWSVLLAYVVGMVTAFLLSKLFVFESSGKHALQEFVKFTLVNLAAVAQVWGISVVLAEFLLPKMGVVSFREEIAHFVGLVIPVFSSYYGHKYFSFRRDASC